MTEAKLQQLAANVLMCKTLKEAAAQSGISERTLRRIRKTGEFQAALDTARAAALERVFDVVCAAAPDSAEQLLKISSDPAAPASARVAAARAVLDLALAYHDQRNILDRIAELETFFERMTTYEDTDDQGGNCPP